MSTREREKSKVRKERAKSALPHAELKRLRMSASKVRLVVDLVRGKPVELAVNILAMTRKAAAKPLLKLLRSAMANAEEKGVSGVENMIVRTAYVNEGPVLKRWLARAMGRATPILKRTSDVTFILGHADEDSAKPVAELAKPTTRSKRSK